MTPANPGIIDEASNYLSRFESRVEDSIYYYDVMTVLYDVMTDLYVLTVLYRPGKIAFSSMYVSRACICLEHVNSWG